MGGVLRSSLFGDEFISKYEFIQVDVPYTQAPQQAGRPIFKNRGSSNYLYYWSPSGNWQIGDNFATDVTESRVLGISYATTHGLFSKRGEDTFCPTQASEWYQWQAKVGQWRGVAIKFRTSQTISGATTLAALTRNQEGNGGGLQIMLVLVGIVIVVPLQYLVRRRLRAFPSTLESTSLSPMQEPLLPLL